MTSLSVKPKLNSRQKLVLINALKGMNQTKAYEAVYGHSPASYKAASNLFLNVHFRAELERLQLGQLQEVTASVLSKVEKRNILANFARAHLIDLVDKDGNIKLDKNNPATKALREYHNKTYTGKDGIKGRAQHIKLIDPLTAIMEDNKMSGDYAPVKSLNAHRIQFEVSLVDKGRQTNEE